MSEVIIKQVNSEFASGMLMAGVANLRSHCNEINELNVFPIPDGDTGDNMLMTLEGGVTAALGASTISEAAKKIQSGMLLSARGNSGVILSQFFAGLAGHFRGIDSPGMADIEEGFRCGVKQAYSAVVYPQEGTILTVAREATEAACEARGRNIAEFLEAFIVEARESLKRTPDLLPVLKDAGVVDSGGAGLLCIMEGMYAFVTGKTVIDSEEVTASKAPAEINPDLFTEDTELEFGYCTELLLRLQTKKTDISTFSEGTIISFLETIGDSIVCVKTGSIVKIHVHTMTPYKVLEFCQKFGEYLTVKIENMMLQHNGTKEEKASNGERKPYGVVAVANGEGIKNTFAEFGCDYVIFGGQTMNPSSKDFISAFEKTNADTIFVLPNNSNIILAAKQAADLYEGADIRVIPTKTIGDAYAVLSMLDFTSDNADEIEKDMTESFSDVVTLEVSQSIRDAEIGDVKVKCGQYLCISGKEILASEPDLFYASASGLNKIDLSMRSLLIIVAGKDANEETTEKIREYITKKYPLIEVSVDNGMQEIYEYIFIAE